jgi:hypothetical protein
MSLLDEQFRKRLAAMFHAWQESVAMALLRGEYRLRLKGGKEYLVTRTYKHNLRDLAQLWVGSELPCGYQ